MYRAHEFTFKYRICISGELSEGIITAAAVAAAAGRRESRRISIIIIVVINSSESFCESKYKYFATLERKSLFLWERNNN